MTTGSSAPAGVPPTRTFKPRRRSLSAGGADVMARLGPLWMLSETGPLLDLADVFTAGRSDPEGGLDVVLEIGIGRGEALIESAGADAATCVIGCDVHTPGIAASLAEIERRRLTNVRLVHGDAIELLDRLRPESLAGIRIYFPDPWPKVRHRHRRIVRDDVVARLVAFVRPGGWLHLATDISDYALQMQRVCDRHPELVGGPVERPTERPLTRYEQRGLAAGRAATDLRYVVAGRRG